VSGWQGGTAHGGVPGTWPLRCRRGRCGRWFGRESWLSPFPSGSRGAKSRSSVWCSVAGWTVVAPGPQCGSEDPASPDRTPFAPCFPQKHVRLFGTPVRAAGFHVLHQFILPCCSALPPSPGALNFVFGGDNMTKGREVILGNYV
jgi:hypothetical protein